MTDVTPPDSWPRRPTRTSRTCRANVPLRRNRPAQRRPPGRGLSVLRRRRHGALGTSPPSPDSLARHPGGRPAVWCRGLGCCRQPSFGPTPSHRPRVDAIANGRADPHETTEQPQNQQRGRYGPGGTAATIRESTGAIQSGRSPADHQPDHPAHRQRGSFRRTAGQPDSRAACTASAVTSVSRSGGSAPSSSGPNQRASDVEPPMSQTVGGAGVSTATR
jgi:hypothetical protein